MIGLEYTYTKLPPVLYTKVIPKNFPHSKLLLFNAELAKQLGLAINEYDEAEKIAFLLGHSPHKQASPIALAYAGHQFGYFTNLGDGRAFLLGEVCTPNHQRYDLHLKGAGKTIYARNGDGNAVLGPMLREYIISEAMHALGIPTTRSLAVIATGEEIWREGFKPGAILVRVAKSHIRVGTFQFARMQSIDPLNALLQYTIARHFPDIADSTQPRALALLHKVIALQAKLMVEWERVGFIHGVMNTDNMAISGETLDYGPCAFIDTYDPNTVFSSIDLEGRYAFKNQPLIAQWNITRLAEALLPLIDTNQQKAIDLAKEALETFPSHYQKLWVNMMRSKLGLIDAKAEDETFAKSFLAIMEKNKMDYTNTFFNLTYSKEVSFQSAAPSLLSWEQQWKQRICNNERAAFQLMQANNPVIIPRNHRVAQAIMMAEEKGEFMAVAALLKALQNPYQLTEDVRCYQTAPTASEQIHQTFCGT